MKELWHSAWISLTRNRLRALMTVCGIAVGTAMVVLISGIGSVGEKAVYRELESMGINGISVSASDGLTVPCLTSIRELSVVSQAMPLVLEFAAAEIGDETLSAVSCGIDAGADQVISLQLLHGRLLSQTDLANEAEVCVIDAALAQEAFGRDNVVGQNLTLLYDNVSLDMTVVGVTATGSSLLQNVTSLIPYMVYVPYTTMQSTAGIDTFDQIAVRINTDSDTAQAQLAIQTSLMHLGEDIGTLKTEDLSNQRARLERLVTVLTLGLTAIGGVSLLVSGCGIMTVMLSSVYERTREIGIKKAIGATRGRILTEFMASALLLSVIGAIVGTALGVAAMTLGGRMLGFSVEWPLGRLAGIFALTLALGVLFGAYPAYKAAGLKPVDALRQEN